MNIRIKQEEEVDCVDGEGRTTRRTFHVGETYNAKPFEVGDRAWGFEIEQCLVFLSVDTFDPITFNPLNA